MSTSLPDELNTFYAPLPATLELCIQASSLTLFLFPELTLSPRATGSLHACLFSCSSLCLPTCLLASKQASSSHAHLHIFIPALPCFASHQLLFPLLPSPANILTCMHLRSLRTQTINLFLFIPTLGLCPAFGFPQLIVNSHQAQRPQHRPAALPASLVASLKPHNLHSL